MSFAYHRSGNSSTTSTGGPGIGTNTAISSSSNTSSSSGKMAFRGSSRGSNSNNNNDAHRIEEANKTLMEMENDRHWVLIIFITITNMCYMILTLSSSPYLCLLCLIRKN